MLEMESVIRSYRIRAYPNGAQRRMLDQWYGAARWLWNTALGIRVEAYRHCKLSLTSVDISRWLTQWKRTAGHEWLGEAPATCLIQCLRDQDAAFRNFFARRARHPRFKRKGGGRSLRFQGVRTAWSRGLLSLPKLGTLKLAEELPSVARPDSVTLSCDALGRFHVSFCAEIEAGSLSLRISHRSVGVDLGLTHLATLSTGEKVANPRRLKAHLRYLRQQQRCLARRQKGSKRRERQRLRVARIQARIRDERQAALHQLTTRLVREFGIIAIEDLNVKALARGYHSRAIHDAAFSEIRRQLRYKSDPAGRVLLEVPRYFASSKTCSKCWHVLDELRLDQREWTCAKCGTCHDRDVNAACSILQEALRIVAGRDDRDLHVDARDACPEDYPFRRRCSQMKREAGIGSRPERATSQ